jgi:hypothetical protein
MYKSILYIAVFSLICLNLDAQKEGNVWFFGGGDPTYPDSAHYKSYRFDFGVDTFSGTFVPHILPFTRSNASICDKDGNFLCLSNGENIYNRDYGIMEGGGDLYPNADYFYGVPGIQTFMLLPYPGNPNKSVQVYGNIKIIYPPSDPNGALVYWLRYAVIDHEANSGLGKVIKKHIPVNTDTLGPGYMTATRHGNGRDWWIFINHYKRKKFFRYVLDPSGIHPVGSQEIEMKPLGLTQTVFSPDGQWYARFSMHGRLPDSIFSTIELYPFDRCSGLLGDIQEKTYSSNPLDGKPGGVAFSASSRYMYVSRWDTIFQYDMQAPDILGSEVVVAAFDGFWGDWGNGFTIPQRFYSLMLGPDGKIYCCVSNYNSKYLHVIHDPEAAGLACDVRQHSIQMPVFNEYSIPNNPYYGLGKWAGSPCDTINAVSATEPHEIGTISLYPNPAQDWVNIVSVRQMEGRAEVYALTGLLVASRNIAFGDNPVRFDLNSGLYVLKITYDNGDISSHKLVIGK